MHTHTRNQQLLDEVCDLIPDAATADLIRSMDPYDHITFAEAYCAVRTLRTLTPDLRRRVLAEIRALAEIEKVHSLAGSDDGPGRPLRVTSPTTVSA